MKVNVVDAGCGVGKTTALINKMNQDNSEQKYLFITPYLSEVERIKKSCPTKDFASPENIGGSKLKNVKELFRNNQNIVTTHALFRHFDEEIIEILKERNYIMVMDEVANIIEEVAITNKDLKTLEKEYVRVHPRTHMLEWTDRCYEGKFEEYKRMIMLNSIFANLDNENNILSLLWLMPYQIFECFKQVFILTYMFEGQIQKGYFDYYHTGYNYLYVDNFQLTSEKVIYDYSQVKKNIEVVSNSKMNKVGQKNTALSKTWFEQNKNKIVMKELSNNIYNFFRWYTKTDGSERLWTTFKDCKRYLQAKGFKGGFAPINSRATNEYSKKRAVAYVSNRYFKPNLKNFFIYNGIVCSEGFEDKFALSELVQFVYRSSIRNGEHITVYIPSKRMRDLFNDWLNKPNE